MKMLDKSMGRIDWTKDAARIERQVRGLNSWPGTYTSLHGKTLKIWESETADGNDGLGENGPGTIVAVEKDAFYIQTGEGILKVTQVQLEGKKRMEVSAFLRGYQIKAGERLE